MPYLHRIQTLLNVLWTRTLAPTCRIDSLYTKTGHHALSDKTLLKKSAPKQLVRESISFRLLIGSIRKSLCFGVVKILAVNLFLGTSFVGKYVTLIFPAEPKHLPWHLRLFEILTQSSKTRHTVLFTSLRSVEIVSHSVCSQRMLLWKQNLKTSIWSTRVATSLNTNRGIHTKE